MKKLFEITVKDEHGAVVETGWVMCEPTDRISGRELDGAELFDEVLDFALNNFCEGTAVQAQQAAGVEL